MKAVLSPELLKILREHGLAEAMRLGLIRLVDVHEAFQDSTKGEKP